MSTSRTILERDHQDVTRLRDYKSFVDGWAVFAPITGSNLFEFAGTAVKNFMDQPGRGTEFKIEYRLIRMAPFRRAGTEDILTALERPGYSEYWLGDDEPLAFYLPIGDRYILGKTSEGCYRSG